MYTVWDKRAKLYTLFRTEQARSQDILREGAILRGDGPNEAGGASLYG